MICSSIWQFDILWYLLHSLGPVNFPLGNSWCATLLQNVADLCPLLVDQKDAVKAGFKIFFQFKKHAHCCWKNFCTSSDWEHLTSSLCLTISGRISKINIKLIKFFFALKIKTQKDPPKKLTAQHDHPPKKQRVDTSNRSSVNFQMMWQENSATR